MNAARSRRVFLNSKTIAGTLFTGLTLRPVHAGETNELKVGLIGCGGRGRGAKSVFQNAGKQPRFFRGMVQ